MTVGCTISVVFETGAFAVVTLSVCVSMSFSVWVSVMLSGTSVVTEGVLP